MINELKGVTATNKIKSIFKYLEYLRIKPFDVTSENGESKERYRKIVLSTITSIIGKFISVFTAFYSVPLTLNYLGPENYGLLMVITSINVLLIFSDLGLGNGLVNSIAKNYSNNKIEELKYNLSSVFFLLSFICIVMLSVFLFLESFFHWDSLFNIKKEIYNFDIQNSIKVYIICFIINIPLSIVYKVQMGFQEIFISNIWQSIGNILGFLMLFVFIKLKFALPYLIFALNGAPLLMTLFAFIHQFWVKRSFLKPRLRYFKLEISIKMIGIGFIFTLINLANVFGSSVDNFILTNNSGPESIVNYTIVTKLFSILYIITFFSSPFWPAFSEAISQNNFIWARKALKKILIVTTSMTIIICGLIVIFHKVIIDLWIGDNISISTELIMGFVVFWIFSAVAQSAVNFMQSEKYLKTLLSFTLIYSIISFICKLYFVKNYGDAGVIWAGGLSYGFIFALPVTFYSFHVLKQNTLKKL